MSDDRPVMLWRLTNGVWDPMGQARPASEAGKLLQAAQEANGKAVREGSGDLFAVLPVDERP